MAYLLSNIYTKNC